MKSRIHILYNCIYSEEIQEIQRKESQTLSGAPNLFVYGSDVDSVDVAVRVAMVRNFQIFIARGILVNNLHLHLYIF